MKKQTIEFMDKMKNFEIKRKIEETEEDTLKRYHKTKLNMCYDYLKLLISMNNGSDNLKEDYTEIKKLTTEFADSYEPTGPFGAKSVGEIGIDTPPAVICNAVYNAVGVRINTLPITPEKILKAMKEKEAHND